MLIVIFPKDGHFALESINQLNCQVISLNWTIKPSYALSILKNKTIQGNSDPCLLYADDKIIEKETLYMLHAFKDVPYIANLGHGLYPDIDK